MNGKKKKYNFTPKKILSKKRNGKINSQEEIKKNSYHKSMKIRPIRIYTYSENRKNNFLTETITNHNNENTHYTKILNKYLEGVREKGNNNKVEQNFLDKERNSNLEKEKEKKIKESNYSNIEAYNFSPELNYIILSNEREKLDFVSILLKLKRIKSCKKKYNKSEKDFTNIKNYTKINNNRKISNYKSKINQKKLLINSKLKKYSKSNKIKKLSKTSLTEENNYIKKYSSRFNNIKKRTENYNKNKDEYINKTLSSKESKNLQKKFKLIMDLNESKINNKNKKSMEKSKSNKRPSGTKNTNKKKIYKEKSHSKSPIIYKNQNKNIGNYKSFKNHKLNLIKNKEILKVIKNNAFHLNEKIIKRKKNDNFIKIKDFENKEGKTKTKTKIEKKKEENKSFSNNICKKNYRNFDSKNLKRVQNYIFSIIDEFNEELKGDNFVNKINDIINENKKIEEDNNNNEQNSSTLMEKKVQIQKEINLNNNKNGIKNHNISILLNDTFNNDIGSTDKKSDSSFFSTSTFNNDLVNYKPIEKNNSNSLINNNMNNINFSIINNSNIYPFINNDNNNANMTLITQTNNNNSISGISDSIRLNPDKKTNFLIEKNSKLINEIDSNDISNIIPLENKDISLDLKINVYDNSKVKNEQKNCYKNEISKNILLDNEEENSIISHLNIYKNKTQNESKEIKLSLIKNKEIINDNINNSSNNNTNISITNLSKLTNFVDSNIKIGENSYINSKINSKNNELKKSKKLQEINESELNNKNEKIKDIIERNEINSNKTLEYKNLKKTIDIEKNNIYKNFGASIDKIYMDNEDNNNYFCINSNENKKIENKRPIKIGKESRDILIFDEPKDNYRNINKIFSLNNKDLKYNSTNTSSKKNIFESEDLNIVNKIIKTNKKDIVNIHNYKNMINANILNNNIKNINNEQFYDKKMINMDSPLKFNNEFIEQKTKKNKIEEKNQSNNFKKIKKTPFNFIKCNNINEKKNKTFKDELKYLINNENTHNKNKTFNFYPDFSPSSPRYINKYMLYNPNNIDEKEVYILTDKNKNNKLKDIYMIEDISINDLKVNKQRNLNNFSLYKNKIAINKNIVKCINENAEVLPPKVRNLNNIYKIKGSYKIYTQQNN